MNPAEARQGDFGSLLRGLHIAAFINTIMMMMTILMVCTYHIPQLFEQAYSAFFVNNFTNIVYSFRKCIKNYHEKTEIKIPFTVFSVLHKF